MAKDMGKPNSNTGKNPSGEKATENEFRCEVPDGFVLIPLLLRRRTTTEVNPYFGHMRNVQITVSVEEHNGLMALMRAMERQDTRFPAIRRPTIGSAVALLGQMLHELAIEPDPTMLAERARREKNAQEGAEREGYRHVPEIDIRAAFQEVGYLGEAPNFPQKDASAPA